MSLNYHNPQQVFNDSMINSTSTPMNECQLFQITKFKNVFIIGAFFFIVIGALLNTFGIYTIQQCKKLPDAIGYEIKMIFIILLFGLISVAILLGNLSKSANHGFHLVSSWRCSLFATPLLASSAWMIYCFNFIGVERWRATRSDEQASKEPNMKLVKMGLWLGLPVSCVASFLFQIQTMLAPNGECFCGAPGVNVPASSIIAGAIAFPITEALVFCLLVQVWMLNKAQLHHFSLTTTKYSVVGRYHIRQTIASTFTILCVYTIQLMVVVPATFFSIYLKCGFDLGRQIELSFWYTFINPIHIILSANVLPLCIFVVNKEIRNKIKLFIKKFFHNNRVDEGFVIGNASLVVYNVTPEANAEILENMWNENAARAKCVE